MDIIELLSVIIISLGVPFASLLGQEGRPSLLLDPVLPLRIEASRAVSPGYVKLTVAESGAPGCGSVMNGYIVRHGDTVTVVLPSKGIVFRAPLLSGDCSGILGVTEEFNMRLTHGDYLLRVLTPKKRFIFHLQVPIWSWLPVGLTSSEGIDPSDAH